MRNYRVELLRTAEDDLLDLFHTIAAQSDVSVAEAYIRRIEAACLGLENSPLRGTKRDNIKPGLRTIGFERRATIVFQVHGSLVTIVRVFYGGQDYERALRRDTS